MHRGDAVNAFAVVSSSPFLFEDVPMRSLDSRILDGGNLL